MLKCRDKRQAVGWLGIASCISMNIVVFITLLFAHFNGGRVVVYALYNEIIIELFLVPFFILLGTYGLYINIKEKI